MLDYLRPRRVARTVLLAGALLALGASAASAATVSVTRTGELRLIGDDRNTKYDIIQMTRFGRADGETVRIRPRSTNQDGLTTDDPDCQPAATDPGAVDCVDVLSIYAEGRGGDDEFDVSTSPTATGTGAFLPATLLGGAGADQLFGGDGADQLNGGEGQDKLRGDAGNDALDGANGDDELEQDAGADNVAGGPGLDTFVVTAKDLANASVAVNVTLDDKANDGTSGENDNVRTSVERVVGGGAGDTLVGSAGINILEGGNGGDTIDGGAGNDVLTGEAGDDTIRSRDGFADFVACGAGNDTAEVDTLDDVQADCENVSRADVGNANDTPEDRPPTVAFTAPAEGAQLPNTEATTLAADAADDKGVAEVLFVDDARIVCVDREAPYTCAYRPTGDDVGRNTLIAVAVDTAGQTAAAVRTVRVDRFTPAKLNLSVRPKSDVTDPRRFRSTGRLGLPEGVTAAQGCTEGVVSVQIKAGRNTISTRRAALRSDCTYRSRVSFTLPRRFSDATRLKFIARFTGNDVLARKRAPRRFVRVRAA